MFQSNVYKRRHQESSKKTDNQLSVCQRALLVGYSVIFGFVLPLICWGAYAVPGHPHRMPHFVFDIPAVQPTHSVSPAAPVAQNSVAATPPHSGGHQHHAPAPSDTTSGEAIQDQPVGQALMSLLLFSVLTYVAYGLWGLLRFDRRYKLLLSVPPFPSSIHLSVPLPPPRPETGAL